MGANLQYQVPLKLIGHIFDKVEYDSGSEVKFIRETSESKYTLLINLYNEVDGLLSKADFEMIEYYRSKLERAELHDDAEMVAELKQTLAEDYDAEKIKDYDQYEGDYSDYLLAAGKQILEEFEDFVEDWEDKEVFIETWL